MQFLDGKYGAGACKYKYSQIQIHFKYIRRLQPRTRFKYSQIHLYLVSGQIPNTVNTYFPSRVARRRKLNLKL